MNNIAIILACLPLYVINSFSDKYVSSKDQNRYNFFYNTIKFLFGTIVLLPLFLCDNGERFGWGVILCGIACGIMYAVSKTVILTGYEKTSVSFMTLCHSSGMIIPCVLGSIFWNEPLTAVAFLGILLVAFSVVLLKDTKKSEQGYNAKGIIAGVLVFLTSGGVMVLQKLMGLYFVNQSINAFNLYSFLTAFILLLLSGKTKKQDKAALKKISPAAALSAVSLCIISIVMTKMASVVPSVILFPLFNGLGIILVCIGSAVVFKEKITVKKGVGIMLGVLGLCLINL